MSAGRIFLGAVSAAAGLASLVLTLTAGTTLLSTELAIIAVLAGIPVLRRPPV